MATTWQLRRGTQAQNDAFTGAPGEITIDLENRSIRLHDGVTQGGWSVFTQGNTLSADTIFFNNTGTSFVGMNVQDVLGEVDNFITDLSVDSHTHTNKVILDAIEDSGSGFIITDNERLTLESAVQDGANIGGGEGQIYKETSTNTISMRTIKAGNNITIDTDSSTNNTVTINATGTIGQAAALINFNPVGTDYASTNVQDALEETDTRLSSVEGLGSVPLGAIIMWSGAIGSIPAKWTLCDGRAAVNGVDIPQLTDRFIVGAGGSYAVGAKGGVVSNSHTHAVTGSTNGHALSVAELPPHTHTQKINGSDSDTHPNSGVYSSGSNFFNADKASTASTYSTGSGQAHSHGLSVTTGVSSVTENRPPYYALAYIIYTG